MSVLDKDIEKGEPASTPSTPGTSARVSVTTDEVPRLDEKTRQDVPPLDPNIVDWDGPDDVENPMNWPKGKRLASVSLASGITFITPLASSIFAPGVPLLMKEFGSSSTLLASFVVSVYLLGFVFGPLVVAPASEIWGRLPVYHVGNIGFLIFCIAAAVADSLPSFCVFRFFQGVFGAVPLTNGGATIGDVVPAEGRGVALAVWALGPLMGPVLGPIIGGFLSQAKGWRWNFWLLAIISGALTIAAFVLMRETYAPILLERKAKRLRKETGNSQLKSKLDTGLKPKDFFLRALVRPSKLLSRSPIVILLSLNMSIAFGYLYLLFTTFTFVFEGQYHFNSGEAGLAFLGLGMGMITGLPVFGKTSDAMVKKQTAKNNGVLKPEYRLPAMIVGAPLIAAGLFGYGWTAQERVHWIAPIILCFPIGLGQIAIFMPTQTYVIDAFGRYAASAIAATTIMRCVFGAFLPLAGQPMYDALGYGWGNSLLGFIALLMSPVPFLFMKYGERIRTSKRFALEL